MRLNFTILILLLLSGTATTTAQQQLTVNKNIKKQHPAPPKQFVLTSTSARPGGSPVRQKCGFADYMAKAKANGFDDAQYETALKTLIRRRIATGQTAFTGIVTVPVVFHSIYRSGDALSVGTANLPASMYQAQIAQLNLDYANLSGSAYGVAADVRIRFCLAQYDTAGRLMAEPGIDRINGTTRGWSNTDALSTNALETYFDGTIKPSSSWDPYSYFNVWTAAMTSSQLLGYATFPALSTNPGLDNGETDGTAGVVIAWESVGSVAVPGNDPTYGGGRTLTHESGHFFGLRHIWGDANCGDDYCADTPPQDAETSGCPSPGALNNCSPSLPKMFENYMDYTDDACVNTFTAGQALRCQTTMDNSIRRLTLMTSKACTARSGNSIQFGTTSPFQVSETGNTGACPNTKSYSFNVYVSDKATGSATVTFSVTGGTATQNLDYTFSPASITYSNNDNAVKKVTVTIIDDQVAEPTENIQIAYAISGTGVIAGPEKQSLSIDIVDDDVAGVAVNNSAPIKTVLSENFNAAAAIPSGWTTAVLDDGSSSYTPNQWVVSANGGTGTTGNAAHITRNTTTKTNQYANANTSDAYLFSPLLDATGVGNLNLSFKWRCLGEVGYDEGYIGYIPEGTAVNAENVIYFDNIYGGLASNVTAATSNVTLPATLTNTKFYLVFNWYNDDNTGSNPPFTVDDISLTGKYFSVAGTTDADTAFTQYAGQTVNYYSKTGTTSRLIATLANPSENLGCVTANIQLSGTGKTALVTDNGSYNRTDKVIKITPAVANSTAAYQATLYFTTAELSPTWTAGEIATMLILKVNDGVNLAGTLTTADAELVTPTFVDNSATGGYYSYTGNFTGFSQFMLVSPNTVLPVRLLSFNLVTNKNSITVNWATSQELNNKGFKIERSTDGIHFESIAFVNGKINSSVVSNYTLTDNFVQANTTYYYRIRQVDINNREELSAVREARINRNGVVVTVSPVPAKDVVNLFINGNAQPASISLFNAQGQLVKTFSKVNAFNSNYGLNVAELPSGIYLLNIQLAEEKIVKKIVIEK